MTNLCFIDTETIGLEADRHDIWEVGLIIRSGQKDHEYEWQLPLPSGLTYADPMALNINRFYERARNEIYKDPFNFQKLKDICLNILTYTDKAHLVGAVVSFDEERLRKLFRFVGLCPTWHYHLVDVEALAAGKLKLEPPWNSKELWEMLGINLVNYKLHTALGDAQLARDIYDIVMK